MPIILSAPAKRKNASGGFDLYFGKPSPQTWAGTFATREQARHKADELTGEYGDPSHGVHIVSARAPAKRMNARRNGEFYAQPYEQYAAYMYSVGKQPMVAWEFAEKQQAYYANKAAKRPQSKAVLEARRAAREAEREAKRAEKEADKARLAADRAADRAAARAVEKTQAKARLAAERAARRVGFNPRRKNARKTALPPMRNNGGARHYARIDRLDKKYQTAKMRAAAANARNRFAKAADYYDAAADAEEEMARLEGAANPRSEMRNMADFMRREALAACKVKAKKAPAKRTNGSRSVVDAVAARELELYVENEASLIGPGNTLGANVMRMLAARIVRGTYDNTKAWKAWSPLVAEGARRYKREIGSLNASKATRDAVATRLSEAFEGAVRSGALNPMKLLGAR